MSTSPAYETQVDRDNEVQIIQEWAARFGFGYRKLPAGPRYSMDFALLKGERVRAFAEVKDRPSWRMKYGNVFLCLRKYRNLYLMERLGFPAYFIARLLGKVHWVRCDFSPVVEIRGRTDRNDPNDVNPVVLIPYERFKQ